jgi:deoxyribodipyrimidine photo-lyase
MTVPVAHVRLFNLILVEGSFMSKRHQLSLFIFRRDLRLQDNTALISACRDSEQVIPCFILDDQQTQVHDYFSERAFSFMLQSLASLAEEIKEKSGQLYFFKGNSKSVVEKLLVDLPIDAVYVNHDYTPFSIKRDQALKTAVEKQGGLFESFDDLLLQPPELVHKDNGLPYTVFTPFMKRSRQIDVLPTQQNCFDNYYNQPIKTSSADYFSKLLKEHHQSLVIPVGYAGAQALLNKAKQLTEYGNLRDFPALGKTSKLSAHNKFGTISIRSVYHTLRQHLGAGSVLINELYWRDFYHHIAFHFPHVFKGAFQERYNQIAWSKNKKYFARWCDGETGFPIVDAGMRELNETGYMHNRVRMIVASFLVKDLHISWQWGEKYFAQQLIDYDPVVNNGSWQWAASTGCDAQPYFRIFNPALQEKRFDPDGVYIQYWLGDKRFEPMVDHKEASAKAKAMFR